MVTDGYGADMLYAARGVQSAWLVAMPCVARDLQSAWLFCRALLPGDHLVIAPQKYGSHLPRELCAASVIIRNNP
jgi:hypothetical protein